MENDEKLEKILHELRDKWNQHHHGSFEEIEKALKGAIHLRVGGYDATIEQFEKNYGNRGRAYRHLTTNQQILLDNMYEKKNNEISLFTRSLCAVMLKQRYGYLHSNSFIIQDLIKSKANQVISALEDKKYFEAIGEELKDYEYAWIRPLYYYYLERIKHETPISFEQLKERVHKEIINPKTVDEWAYFFRGEEFTALAKWVKEFIESVNKKMIAEVKTSIEALQERIIPTFYLLKTTENGSAIVFNEYGNLYVFIKGCKSPILYNSEKFKSDFYEIRKLSPTAFPEFHPEKW